MGKKEITFNANRKAKCALLAKDPYINTVVLSFFPYYKSVIYKS